MSYENEIIWSQWDQTISFSWDIQKKWDKISKAKPHTYVHMYPLSRNPWSAPGACRALLTPVTKSPSLENSLENRNVIICAFPRARKDKAYRAPGVLAFESLSTRRGAETIYAMVRFPELRHRKQWLCFFGTKTAYAASSPAPPAYADHTTGDG